MSRRKVWFYKFSLAGVVFSTTVISAVLIRGETAKPHRGGVVDDWSFHHLVFSNPGTQEQAIAKGTYSKWIKLHNDTRFIMQRIRRSTGVRPLADPGTADVSALADRRAAVLRAPTKPPPKEGSINKDWSENLITGKVQPNMYPAMYGVSPTSASCSGDFIAFPTGSAGATNSASIIAYYELYSSCTGSPSVYWAYNTNGGTISNSPITYTDGVQLAFIQVTGTTASLVVLKSAKGSSVSVTSPTSFTSKTQTYSGSGNTGKCSTTSGSPTVNCTGSSVDFTASEDLGAAVTVTGFTGTQIITAVNSKTQITLSGNATTTEASGSATVTVAGFNTTGFVSPANYRSCTAPCMTSLALDGGSSGSPNNTFSAPFYDFTDDDLYVGDNSGKLHQFTGVFLGTPTENMTSPWPVTLSGELTPPVYDPTSGYVFVGNMGGILYAVASGNEGTTSGQIHGTSASLGNGIMDAPLVDPNAEEVYVFVTGNSVNDNAVFQFNASFTGGTGNGSTSGTEVGSGGATGSEYYLYAGDFDNVYYESMTTPPSGNLYIIGGTGATGGATLYQIPITITGMGTPIAAVTGLTSTEPWSSPLTEFCNNGASPCGLNAGGTATTSGTDFLFFSVYNANSGASGCSTGSGCVLSYNISNPTSVAISGSGLSVNAQASPGCWVTSGIVIDNSDTTTVGASQIYFINLNGNGAGGPGGYTSTSCTNNNDTHTIAATQAAQSSPSGNLVPTLTSLSPSSANVGTAAETLTINGTNFLSGPTGTGSAVTYNGVSHTPTFVSVNELTIQLTSGDLSTAGTYPVVVTNPPLSGLGGGASNTLNFTVMGPTAPIAGLSPASFTFASQPAMTSSSAEGFTLSNTGNAALSITSIGFTGTNPGDFSQITTCGSTLALSTTCTIAVIFTPAASGSRSATLVVTDNSNNVVGSTQSSTLTGTGAHDVILTWTPSSTSGITGYNVYRGLASGAESATPLNSTCVDATTYVDTNVTAGTTYYYVVTAVMGTTQSPDSGETSATVPTP